MSVLSKLARKTRQIVDIQPTQYRLCSVARKHAHQPVRLHRKALVAIVGQATPRADPRRTTATRTTRRDRTRRIQPVVLGQVDWLGVEALAGTCRLVVGERVGEEEVGGGGGEAWTR